MKSYIKKRKHRNGVRPVRKGSIKIRMVEFPDSRTQLDSCDGAVSYVTKALLDLVNTPYDKAKEHNEKNTYLTHCNRVAKLFQRGYEFITEQNQIAPVDLALDVINEVTPVFVKESEPDHMAHCKSCEHKNDCPYDHREGFDKVQWCPFLRYNFGTYALNKSKAKESLNCADLAELALTHLS